MAIRWMTAFWDLPSRSFIATTEFWLNVTRSRLSGFRGPDQEFATLLPPEGDPCLRVQCVRSGPGGNHLDLHVDNVVQEAERAQSLGATRLSEEEELAVMRSPGGFVFCIVDHHGESTPPPPVFSPAGQLSLVDQLCIDIPPRLYDTEAQFWHALTGFDRPTTRLPEFQRLESPAGLPLRLLLQRLEAAEPDQPVRAHIDLACNDIDAESARHVSLGATLGERFEYWQVMFDPSGLTYCITDNDPEAVKRHHG